MDMIWSGQDVDLLRDVTELPAQAEKSSVIL